MWIVPPEDVRLDGYRWSNIKENALFVLQTRTLPDSTDECES
jgi:hypothetical protein